MGFINVFYQNEQIFQFTLEIYASLSLHRGAGRITGAKEANNNAGKDGNAMKEEEKKPIPWEAVDPKPPVIRSGRTENHRQNRKVM